MRTVQKKWEKYAYHLVILSILTISCIMVTGCSGTQSISQPVREIQTNVKTESTPSTLVQTQVTLQTPAQIDHWISGIMSKPVYNPGDTASVNGEISGGKGPVLISFFLYKDAVAKDFSKPIKTTSVNPDPDNTFHYSFTITPTEFPVEFYVIMLKLPTGESTKFHFNVEAKGVNCEKVCSQPGSTLRYNEKGEAICPCAWYK